MFPFIMCLRPNDGNVFALRMMIYLIKVFWI